MTSTTTTTMMTTFKVLFFICFCHLMTFMPYILHLTSPNKNTLYIYYAVARTAFVRIRHTGRWLNVNTDEGMKGRQLIFYLSDQRIRLFVGLFVCFFLRWRFPNQIIYICFISFHFIIALCLSFCICLLVYFMMFTEIQPFDWMRAAKECCNRKKLIENMNIYTESREKQKGDTEYVEKKS